MAAAPQTPEQLGDLAESLLKPTALTEAAVLLTCLGLAWVVVRLVRGPAPRPGSIWFGERLIDGALFPMLALIFAFAASRLMIAFVPAAVFKVALPVLISLAAIRLTVRVLRLAFPASQVMRVVERSVSWVAWVAVVLWITGVLPVVLDELDGIRWKLGDSQISLRNVIEGALSAAIVLVIVLWISAVIESRLLKGTIANLSMRKMASNLMRAVLLFIGLLFALSAAGIDLTALGFLGGAVGVGIGFGLQKLASNYVSGFVILAERSLRIGDMIKVDGFEGYVTDINTRATIIRSLNGRESIVPNEMLITQRVENMSLSDSTVALTTKVQVAYGADMDKLVPKLAAAISAVPRVLKNPGPDVQLQAFGTHGLELAISFWIEDPHTGQGNVRSDVNLAILRTLEAEGVEIPYPQTAARQFAARPEK
jgi:small-conductance mechanosensitive channel